VLESTPTSILQDTEGDSIGVFAVHALRPNHQEALVNVGPVGDTARLARAIENASVHVANDYPRAYAAFTIQVLPFVEQVDLHPPTSRIDVVDPFNDAVAPRTVWLGNAERGDQRHAWREPRWERHLRQSRWIDLIRIENPLELAPFRLGRQCQWWRWWCFCRGASSGREQRDQRE
jgi:hypothetical protein